MKKTLLIIVLLLFTVSAACAGDLSDIKDSGILRMAVSPDRWPFAYYDRNDDLTGIDVKLMEEIAGRMGVTLEVTEMDPEDLTESLALSRVDVVGGAFSRLDSRKNEVDYTNLYYSTIGVFMIRADAGFGGPEGMDPLAGRKVGVLKNSCFEEWLKEDVVDGENVLLKDIYTYSRIEDAIKALSRGKIDMVMIDTNLYDTRYANDPAFAKVDLEAVKDNYAFGLRKNSDLRSEINKNLSAILKDGTAQSIADKFFSDIEADEEPAVIQWTSKKPAATATASPISFTIPTVAPVTIATEVPTVPPVIFPTAPAQVVLPTSVPTQGACTYAMSYVADVTVPDGQKITGGSQFTKTWRIKNTGTCGWTTDFTISFVSGAQMNGSTQKMPKPVYPGETVDLSVYLTAPTAPGNYRGYWQIKTGTNYAVGPAIWVQITVPAGEGTPEAYTYYVPTPTPYYYGYLPTDSYAYTYTYEELQAQMPRIESYYPNAYTNKSDQCVTVYWDVQNAGTAELFVDGKSIYFGNAGTGMTTICAEVQTVGVHYITLYGYNAGGIEAHETLLYTTIP